MTPWWACSAPRPSSWSNRTASEPSRWRSIEARSGDIVLLAGKGHETTQVLKDRVLEFDDREMARKFLRLRGYGG